ncbi:MAG: hypothetical protein FWD71_02700 [Oscillospiraceae bacterium]|nr:hypothetical protein [Oscillospiraceae bacterium]
MRLKTVHQLSNQYKIVVLCRVLRVNRSTYYKHCRSKESKRDQENQKIRTAILEIYTASKKRFGMHKINQKLPEFGKNIDGQA